jgi:hypothetical protein
LRLPWTACVTIWAHFPSSGVAACVVLHLFARAVRVRVRWPLVLTVHLLCKCYWIVLRTAGLTVPPFSGPDYWQWSPPWWLLLTGNPVFTAGFQIPPALIHRDHLLLSGKISLKYTQIRPAMILCSDYSAQRRDRLPRAEDVRGVRSGF